MSSTMGSCPDLFSCFWPFLIIVIGWELLSILFDHGLKPTLFLKLEEPKRILFPYLPSIITSPSNGFKGRISSLKTKVFDPFKGSSSVNCEEGRIFWWGWLYIAVNGIYYVPTFPPVKNMLSGPSIK